MIINFSWSMLASIVSALSGVVGSIVTPLYGSHVTASVQAVLAALSALLIVIAGYHVTSVAAANAKAKAAAKLRGPLTGRAP